MVKIIARKNKEIKVNGPNNTVGTYPDPRQLFNNTELDSVYATREWETKREEHYESPTYDNLGARPRVSDKRDGNAREEYRKKQDRESPKNPTI